VTKTELNSCLSLFGLMCCLVKQKYIPLFFFFSVCMWQRRGWTELRWGP